MRTYGGRQNNQGAQGLGAIVATAVALVFAIQNSHSAFANADIDSVCSKAFAQAGQCSSAAPPGGAAAPAGGGSNCQKLQYCQAAQSADDAASTDGILWKVWAGVAAVCTYACVASFVGGPTSEYVCMGAQVGGGVVDAVMSKQMTGAMMAIASVGGSLAMSQATKSAGTEAAKKAGEEGGKQETQKDIGACIGAATATLQAITKSGDEKTQNKARDDNLESAKAIQDDNSAAVAQGGSYQGPQNPQNNDMSQAPGSGAGGGNAIAGGSNDPNSKQSLCNQAKSNPSNAGAVISCALASDKTLPGFVRDPRFAKNFQNASGEPLGDFFGKNQGDARQGMMEATGGMLNSGQSAQLSAAMAQVPDTVAGESAGGVYSSGGGDGSGGGGDGAGGMDPMMAQMMAQIAQMLNPEDAAAAKKRLDGVNRVHFATQNRGPAQVPEDKTLSIFDRIAYRYIMVSRRMIGGGK